MQRLQPETHFHDLRLQRAAQSAAADCQEGERDAALPLRTAAPLELDPKLQVSSEGAVQCTAWCTDFARAAAERQRCMTRCLQHPGVATWQHSLQQQAASAHTQPRCELATRSGAASARSCLARCPLNSPGSSRRLLQTETLF